MEIKKSLTTKIPIRAKKQKTTNLKKNGKELVTAAI